MDNRKGTIAFNTFAPAQKQKLKTQGYFEALQASIAVAMNIAYNAAQRPEEFTLLSTGLPVLQHSFYTKQNSYLLRKHLGYLMKDNPDGIVSMLQLLLDRKMLPRITAPDELAGSDKRISDFFQAEGLGLLYELYQGKENQGWSNRIRERLENMSADPSKKNELLNVWLKVVFPEDRGSLGWGLELLRKIPDENEMRLY